MKALKYILMVCALFCISAYAYFYYQQTIPQCEPKYPVVVDISLNGREYSAGLFSDSLSKFYTVKMDAPKRILDSIGISTSEPISWAYLVGSGTQLGDHVELAVVYIKTFYGYHVTAYKKDGGRFSQTKFAQLKSRFASPRDVSLMYQKLFNKHPSTTLAIYDSGNQFDGLCFSWELQRELKL